VVSKTHLDRALSDAHVSVSALLTNPPSCFPALRFGIGQLQCLHGQHRIRIGSELLPPGDRWWSVDIYLEGEIPPLQLWLSTGSNRCRTQISVMSSEPRFWKSIRTGSLPVTGKSIGRFGSMIVNITLAFVRGGCPDYQKIKRSG
jgi:hypothetical protein